jgi:recombination associated protein RdgC
MFKNASVFRIQSAPSMMSASVIEAAEKAAFTPCGATQEKSLGWVPPRGQANGALIESVAGHQFLKLMIESRSVPGKALTEFVDTKCAEIEAKTGRKPGKKEKREMKDEAKLTLLPQAFPKKTAVMVWIDPTNGYLVVDSASQSKIDEVLTKIIQLAEGIVLLPINTAVSPSTAMTQWLAEGDTVEPESRFNIEIGDSCELKAQDETKARVRYNNSNLVCDEVAQHIHQGKTATKLGLGYRRRIDFTLTETGTLTGIKFLDVVFADSKKTQEDEFDANATILTGEMSTLLPDLIESLGGVQIAGESTTQTV